MGITSVSYSGQTPTPQDLQVLLAYCIQQMGGAIVLSGSELEQLRTGDPVLLEYETLDDPWTIIVKVVERERTFAKYRYKKNFMPVVTPSDPDDEETDLPF